MTRRKRTPSPSPFSPQKRVAFEIPASLQQFSTISRSLATNRELYASGGSGQPAPSSQSETRPSSQSSLHSAASLSNGPKSVGNATSQLVAPKRASADAQAGQQSVSGNQRRPAASESVEHPRTHQNVVSGSPPFAAAQAKASFAPPSTSPQARREHIPSTTPTGIQEPPLKPGEAPSLVTHPNLIASLIAQKRAENEAKGMRELWARRQAEYRKSRSPASELATEVDTEAARNETPKNTPQAISHHPPARPIAPQRMAYAPALSRLETRTPGAETVSTPATEPSAKEMDKDTQTPRQALASENDSLFGSPFSSPMAEFLERATDNVGLKDAIEPTSAASTRTSAAQTPPQMAAMRATSSHVNEPSKLSKAVTIPPLFSDNPKLTQQPPQNQPYHDHVRPNAATLHNQYGAMQKQHQTSTSVPAQPSAPRQASVGSTPSAGGRPLSLPQRHPYFQQTPTPSGYYKVDFRTSPGMTSSTVPSTFPPAQYGKPPGHIDPRYPHYGMGMLPMYPMAQPMQGPIAAYGVAAPSAVTPPSQQPRQQPSASNVLTPADMVAGINTRFKISTQNDFVVPKR